MNIIHVGIVESTNATAKEQMESLCHGDVLVADTQTAGQGQRGSRWMSDVHGNVYLSMVLKPENLLPDAAPKLTLKMAEALTLLLKQYGVEAVVKPPNDVLVKGKKIAGILAQAISQGNQVKSIVLGVGVNLTMSAEDLAAIDQPATSLNLHTDQMIDRDAFIESLCLGFESIN